MKLIKYSIYTTLFIVLVVRCSTTTNNPSALNLEIDTSYYSNGKIKAIESLLGKYKYGHQIEYDSLGHVTYEADYINDTLDGKEYVHNPDDYGTENFYEMGKRKITSRVGIFWDTLWVKEYYTVTASNDTAFPIGDITFNRKNIIDTLSTFYKLNYKADTISLDKPFDFSLLLFSLKYYDTYKIKLFLTDNKNCVKFIDTLIEKKGKTRCELECSIKPLSVGKNKIRGLIEVSDTDIVKGHIIPAKYTLPLYLNFFVK